MKIRPFHPADQLAVKNLIIRGLEEHFKDFRAERNSDLDDILANYVKAGHLFVVGEVEEQVVASGALIMEGPGVARIVRVSVKSSFRRRGFGRQITNYLISMAPHFGFEKILVETNDNWHSAIQLYKNCGFYEVDRRNGEIHFECVIKGSD